MESRRFSIEGGGDWESEKDSLFNERVAAASATSVEGRRARACGVVCATDLASSFLGQLVFHAIFARYRPLRA